MDPISPWYTSYNRVATPTGITSTFQTTPSTTAESETHQVASAVVDTLAVPSTTSTPILLQTTTNTTTTLAGQPSPFNPGGFLSTPTAVGFDVFTSYFHHSNSKQATQYVSQQPLARAQVATSKPSSPSESDIPTLRSSYASPQESDTFFEHQAADASPTAANWSLSHTNNTQLTSPFGILPHESVTSPPGPPTTSKPASAVTFDNPFVTHYNSNGTAVTGTDSKTGAWPNADPNKKSRTQSPINNSSTIKCIVTESSIPGAHTFFQGTTAFDSVGLSTTYTDDQAATDASSVQPSLHHQSCIVSTPSNKEFRISQLNPRSPVPTTIYLTTTTQEKQTAQVPHNEHAGPDPGHDSSQSSPISFSIMDSRTLNYNTNSKPNQPTAANGVQFHVLTQQSQPGSCRHYSSTTDAEYHHPARSKSAASTDSAYSSNTSQNGPDCAVVVPRRPSPLQAHSQASPLGHVPSPATYPMYNSPMASMSSPSPLQPQQHADSAASTPYKAGGMQQMTPPSPLDVTVTRPPSQQGQVVYSSVITRALGANENKTSFTVDASNRANYERPQDFPQTKPMCWENDVRQQTTDPRKFPSSNYLSTEDTDSNVLANQHMRILNVSDRQSCLEATQINLQDLSSCRGDPMSIIKNLQNSSGDSDDHEDDRQRHEIVTAGTIGVKRKSLDKVGDLLGTTHTAEYMNRIPPPAHHNTMVNQPQQNGYIEFERWNLALPHTKLITSTPATFATQQPQQQQTQQIHTTNLVGNTVVQHQPLLVTHHNAPTVSYFPTFHITTSNHHMAPLQQSHPSQHQQTQEMHTTVELNSIAMIDTNGCQQNATIIGEPIKDDRPQVIVPNIEEELDFLQQTNMMGIVNNTQQCIVPEMKRSVNNYPNSGFMTSYLKFLQGEKDSSPPPATRGGRKAAWNNRKPYIPVESNGGDAWNRGNTTSLSSTEKPKETPTIDYANDPRYFPLPKERKNHSLDSSDDGFSSDDELRPFGLKRSERKNNTVDNISQIVNHAPPPPIPVKVQEPRPKKGRPIKPGGPTDRKRKAAAAAAAAAAEAATKGIVYPPAGEPKKKKAQQLPRRESSRRKAKEKTSVKEILESQRTGDPYDVEEEQGDSDSDPAWTPAAKSVGDDEDKRKKRGRPVISKRKRFFDVELKEQIVAPKRPGRKRRKMMDFNHRNNTVKFGCKIDEKLLASVSDEDIDISPFTHSTIGESQDASGEFVVIKSDLEQEFPPLWRIDGKTLLQKYEPFQSNGKTLYRNISTYSGWAPQNRHIYQQVPVKFWQQGKLETIVEFLREEMILDDSECINLLMKDTEKYQDNFEVYIQTLISQALDSNFLTEIFQEQDDYFLSNVKTVDEITEERKQRLLSTTSWRQSVVNALSTWPCINVLKDGIADSKNKSCAGCTRTKIHARVLLYGQPYNSTTLEGSPPDPQVPQEKDFLFCRVCQTKVRLFNKVAHQKYLMFLECARRVADKRLADQHKDTTIILNELLADEAWLNQLFKDVRNFWAEIDCMHQHARRKANSAAANAGLNTLNSSEQGMRMPCASILTNTAQEMNYNDQMLNNYS